MPPARTIVSSAAPPGYAPAIDADAVADLIAALDSDILPATLDAFLCDRVPFDLSVIFAYPFDRTPLLLHDGYRGQATRQALDAYLAGGYLLDPFYTASVGQHAPGLWRMCQLSPGEFFESAFFASADVHPCVSMEPGSLVEEVGFLVPLPAGFTVAYSLMRSRGREPFSDDEMANLRAVEPIVRQVVQQHWKSLRTSPPRRVSDMEEAFETFCADVLTYQQRRVVQLILRGHGSCAVAGIIGVAEGTVKIHRKHIYRRLGISSQSELFALFVRHAQRMRPDGTVAGWRGPAAMQLV